MQATLNPAENFTINRILGNHLDSSTYYVRAVVYDSDTRAVIATLDLTDNGNRWFSKQWKVPYDNVWGNGKRVVIVTSVYTDSGYTSKSENHADESEEYLIQQRWNPTVHFGSGGQDFDQEKFFSRFSTEMKNMLQPLLELEPVEFPKVDEAKLVQDFMTGMEECVAKHVGGITIPEAVNVKPIVEQLTAIARMIFERPKFEKTDLTELISGNKVLQQAMKEMYEDVVKVQEEIIVTLMKENDQLRTMTNGQGGTVKFEMDKTNQKRANRLKFLAAKHGIKAHI